MTGGSAHDPMNERHVELLRRTSRTFLLPILQAPPVLRDTVGPAYLCMRAIDEIEDESLREDIIARLTHWLERRRQG